MKYKKNILYAIIISIFIFLVIIAILAQKGKRNNQSKITHKNIDIKTTSSISPYKYYKTYLYIYEEDDWEPETFYYQFLEEPDDSFFGETLCVEDEKLDSSIFEKYNVLAFVKISNYSFTLESYYLSYSCKLEITLNESAIYENFEESTNCAFGGIIMIPKNQPIEDIDFFLNNKSENDNYIIHKKSVNKPENYYKNYSEKLITKDIIKNSKFTNLGDFYIKLISTKEDLQKLSKELKFINDIDLLNSYYTNLFLYRNILLCVRNSNGDFYCEPQIDIDSYYQDVWNTKNLKITEYFYNTSQKDYIAYYSLIPLPKNIDLENISIEKEEINYQNFQDNEVKINFKQAEKIAQNYFNTTKSLASSSFLEITNLNRVKDPSSKEAIENPCYRRMWYFIDEYFNQIYIDTSTGQILDYFL